MGKNLKHSFGWNPSSWMWIQGSTEPGGRAHVCGSFLVVHDLVFASGLPYVLLRHANLCGSEYPSALLFLHKRNGTQIL